MHTLIAKFFLLEFKGEAGRHVAAAIAEFQAQLLNKNANRKPRPQPNRSILSKDEQNLEACLLLININKKQETIIEINVNIQISAVPKDYITTCY